MKKYLQEPTKENIWKSINDNSFDRISDVRNFINGLDMIEDNAFISLDAQWGAGKTFFVRQVEEILKYLAQGINYELPLENKNQHSFNLIDKIKLNKSYLPVYYNAWE